MINEETSVQQMPRRRSNSLPIPKIEVSIYQSPENKKKDVSKDFMEVPEVRDVSLLTGTFVKILTNFVRILIKCFIFFFFSCSNLGHDGDTTSHTRRASEKSKKRMKMADLKAFVETKLLSKSEKALEKIGQEDSKMLFDQVIDVIMHSELLNFFHPFLLIHFHP